MISRRGLKIPTLVVLVGGVAALYFSPLHNYFTRENILHAVEQMRGLWYGPFVLIIAYGGGCIFAIPASVCILAAGAIWGWQGGTVPRRRPSRSLRQAGRSRLAASESQRLRFASHRPADSRSPLRGLELRRRHRPNEFRRILSGHTPGHAAGASGLRVLRRCALQRNDDPGRCRQKIGDRGRPSDLDDRRDRTSQTPFREEGSYRVGAAARDSAILACRSLMSNGFRRMAKTRPSARFFRSFSAMAVTTITERFAIPGFARCIQARTSNPLAVGIIRSSRTTSKSPSRKASIVSRPSAANSMA